MPGRYVEIQLLPTTFDENGCASQRQHLCCFVVDDCVAVDAGSLATAASDRQRENVRDVVLTHAHLDHIAGLPLFVDDLFSGLEQPICVHATAEVVETLETDFFNWRIYPRFSELENENGRVLSYQPFKVEKDFRVKHLTFKAIEVNHKVPSVGLIFGDGSRKVAISGDTSEMQRFWNVLNDEADLDALFIECAFPDELGDLACSSHHFTPRLLARELTKFQNKDCRIYGVNLKPMYRERIIEQLDALEIKNFEVLEIGRVYKF